MPPVRERKFIALGRDIRSAAQTSSARKASRNQTSRPDSNATTSKRHAGTTLTRVAR